MHGGVIMIYFTSDLHLGHNNIISLSHRPFSSIEEMNKTLINNWNSWVNKNDTIYILGDIAFKMKVEEVNQLIKKLNGKKILIRGNHDKKYDESLFEEICDFKVIKYNGFVFSLMHYPLLEWPHFFHQGIHLHGHQHNHKDYNLKMREEGIRRYDVGVDANEYRPISIEEILAFMEELL